MPPPRLDADEVIFVEVARPPGDVGKLAGEIDNVLTGAAAGLNGVAGFAGQVPLQNAADRLMVTVKGRRVEPPVGLEAATIFAKFNDILSHDSLPERRHPRCQAIAFML